MTSVAHATPGRWIGMGWGIVREDLGNFILITLIALALATVGSFVVAGPLLAGLFIAVRQRLLEGRMDISDLFSGFSFFIDTFLIFIVSTIFSLVGLAFCILPVFIVTAFYLFPYLYLVDRKLTFWEAMEASRRLATQHLAGYTVFVILLLLLNLLGLMLLGVGVLITIPVTIAAITVAYKESVGFSYTPQETRGPIVIP
ncbi:MAG TPA: hypothetical protein VE398_25440 [Acidobacteriota bacterium]|nr:hypothetical protein [Acidobacteriota bacterium]